MFGYFIIKKNIFYLIFQNLLTTIRNSLRNLILDYFKSIINKIYYFNLKSSCFTIFCLKNQHYFTNNHFILFIKIYFSEKNLNIIYEAPHEEIFIEVKAERYTKSFNRGSIMLKSTVFPGWGQTNISKGKPWWLTGLVTYGTLAGGYLFHKSYLKSYDSYKIEVDPIKRADLLGQTQKQRNISTVMIYSAVSAWAVNFIWVALTPNRYKPLEHAKFSLHSSPDPYNGGLLLSLRLDF